MIVIPYWQIDSIWMDVTVDNVRIKTNGILWNINLNYNIKRLVL